MVAVFLAYDNAHALGSMSAELNLGPEHHERLLQALHGNAGLAERGRQLESVGEGVHQTHGLNWKADGAPPRFLSRLPPRASVQNLLSFCVHHLLSLDAPIGGRQHILCNDRALGSGGSQGSSSGIRRENSGSGISLSLSPENFHDLRLFRMRSVRRAHGRSP